VCWGGLGFVPFRAKGGLGGNSLSGTPGIRRIDLSKLKLSVEYLIDDLRDWIIPLYAVTEK